VTLYPLFPFISCIYHIILAFIDDADLACKRKHIEVIIQIAGLIIEIILVMLLLFLIILLLGWILFLVFYWHRNQGFQLHRYHINCSLFH
jgi:hypothetical protein